MKKPYVIIPSVITSYPVPGDYSNVEYSESPRLVAVAHIVSMEPVTHVSEHPHRFSQGGTIYTSDGRQLIVFLKDWHAVFVEVQQAMEP